MRTSAPAYIRERRAASPEWVRRHRRSLGNNKQHRACIRRGHEARRAAQVHEDLVKRMAADQAKRNAEKAAAAQRDAKPWAKAKKFFAGLLNRARGQK